MQISSSNSGLSRIRLWSRLPVLLRAPLLGFIICFGGITLWTTGYAVFPLPYSLVYVVAFLFFYIAFLSGKVGPEKTSTFRKANFRSLNLSRSIWIKGVVGSLLFVIIVQACLVITFRLTPFPEHTFKSQYQVLDSLPKVLAWGLVLAGALVAGICEETGFRGYLQVPLEKKYGVSRGILLSSILFTLVHLSKAWAGGIVIQIFFAGLLLGILAYKTGSLIPSIIGHVLLDIINFSYWWSHLAGNFTQKTIAQTGIDNGFIFWLVLFISAVIGFFKLMQKLNTSVVNNVDDKKVQALN